MKKTRFLALALAIVMVVCALPMAAFAAYTPMTKAELTNMKNEGVLTSANEWDYSKESTKQYTDGNPNNSYLYLFKYNDGAAKGGAKVSGAINRQNLKWDSEEQALMLFKYDAANSQVTYNGKHFDASASATIDVTNKDNNTAEFKAGDEFYYNSTTKAASDTYAEGLIPVYVTTVGTISATETKYTVLKANIWVNPTTFETVAAGTEGAVPIAVASDDNNNGAYASSSTYLNILSNVFVNTLRIQHIPGGVVNTVFQAVTKNSIGPSGSINGEGVFAFNSKNIAKFEAGVYYDLAQVLYCKQVGTDGEGAALYTWYCDIYIDGLKAYTGEINSAYKSKTEAEMNAADQYRYTFAIKSTGRTGSGTPTNNEIPAAYIKNLQVYYGDASKFTYTDYCNSGNSIEDFMPVMDHGEFGIEGYLNLTTDMLADANAKVVLMRGSTQVSEVKVSELEADAKGRYKFTLGLDWAGVGNDIKIKVTNGTSNYYLYYNGTASQELLLFTKTGGVNGSTILEYADFSETSANAGLQVDGNNSAWNTFMYVFTEAGVKLTATTTRQNVFYEYTDGDNGKVLRIVQYEGSAKQATYRGQNFEETALKTVSVDGDHAATYKQSDVVYLNAELNALVEKGTEGAVPAVLYENSSKSGAKTNLKVAVGTTYVVYDAETQAVTKADKDTPGAVLMAVRSDDSNNGFQSYRSNGTSFLTHDLVISMNFRYTGTGTMDLIVPTMHGSATAGGSGFNQYVSITPNNKALNVLGTPVAFLDTTRYYDLDAIFSVKETDEDAYTLVCDLYLDGILVYSGKVNDAYTDKPLSAFEGNNTFRYNFIRPASCCNYGETQTDIIYFKSLKDVLIPNGMYSGEDIATNSGDTIEGYYATLGSKLELNYFLNLLPDVVADPNAEIQFSIDDEVISAQKIADAELVEDGGYIFTCPVNSTQMASEIKVSIESSTREYKIYMFGEALDSYTYSVAEYANDVLEMMDAMPDETFSAEEKALIKTLVESMLNYGAYAQTYFAAKNDTALGDLANAGCEYTEAELAAANFGTGTITGATVGMTATLVLDTDTTINIYKNGVLVGQSEGITADKLNADVEIDCGDTTVKVSVLTLAGMVPEGNTNFKNLAKALALYSAATEAFEAYVNSQE